MTWSRIYVVIIAACLELVFGCVGYQRQPIDPERMASAFESRRLRDPGLREYMQRLQDRLDRPWPPERLDLASLTWIAYYFHPDLDVARAKVALGDAGITTAEGRPNPTVRVLSQRDVLVEGTTPWTLGLSLDIPIETAGKRGYRIKAAEQLAAGARLDLANVAWAVRSRVRARLAELTLLQEEMNLLDEEAKLQRELVQMLERRLQLGEASRPEVERRRVELQQAEVARLLVRREYEGARVALAESVGVPVTALQGHAFGDLPLSGEMFTPRDALSLQLEGLQNRLDLRRILLDYEASEWTLRLEVAKQYPDVHLGPGYAWNQGFDRWVLGVSLTLPVLNQNQGPIAEALARRDEIASRFEQLQATAIAQISQAAVRLREARTALTRVENELLPLQQSRERSIQSTFAAGEASRLDLSLARLETVTILKGRTQARRAVQNAVSALEDAIQRPLDIREGRPPHVEDNPRTSEAVPQGKGAP